MVAYSATLKKIFLSATPMLSFHSCLQNFDKLDIHSYRVARNFPDIGLEHQNKKKGPYGGMS